MNPAGSAIPLASGAPSAPYGPVPGWAGAVRGTAPQGPAEYGGAAAEGGRTKGRYDVPLSLQVAVTAPPPIGDGGVRAVNLRE
ncbi:hypothetical protein GCM10018777_37410 [Streptomyces albogriseolus]|nr:hypothetical protein GCM10018777_37410 [Streptomyces viridodiastaticus]